MANLELKITEINVADGVVQERTPTQNEEQDYNLLIQEQARFKKDLEAKASARESALAKLAAIGLTEEEIRAL